MTPLDRFGGIARLYGTAALDQFQHSHIAIVGIGGVGSWAAESLARSGIGHLTLIDLDDLCVTNTNRQIHAMQSTIGQQKTHAMAARLRDINPDLTLTCHDSFYSARSSDTLLAPPEPYHYILDAIDQTREKTHLLAAATERQIPIITCGGAGGLTDPSKIRKDDLSRTTHDPLLAHIRARLRKYHRFPKGDGKKPKKFHLPAIYSTQSPVYPQCDGSVSPTRDSDPAADSRNMRLNCASGFGSITHITATFAYHATAHILDHLTAQATTT